MAPKTAVRPRRGPAPPYGYMPGPYGEIINPSERTYDFTGFLPSSILGVGDDTIDDTIVEINPSSGWTNDFPGCHCLVVDLPGFKKDDIKLNVDKSGIIEVSGRRKVNDENQEHFTKTFNVPEDGDVKNIELIFDSGKLRVRIPGMVEEINPSSRWTDEFPGFHCLLINDLLGFNEDDIKLNVDKRGIIVVSGRRKSAGLKHEIFEKKFNVPVDGDTIHVNNIQKKFDGATTLKVFIPRPVEEEIIPSSRWTNDIPGSHCLLVNLPDFKRDDMEVEVDESGVIVVRGRRQVGGRKQEHFIKAFYVPGDRDMKSVKQTFEGDMLRVWIPKVAATEKGKPSTNKDKKESNIIPDENPASSNGVMDKGNEQVSSSTGVVDKGKEQVSSSSELMDKGKEASSSNNTMVEKGKEVSSNSEIMDKGKEQGSSSNNIMDKCKEQVSSSSELMDKGKEASSSNNTMVEKGKEVSSNSEIMDKGKEQGSSSNNIMDKGKEQVSSSSELMDKGKEASSSNNTMVEKGKEVSSNSEIMDKGKEQGSSSNNIMDKGKEQVSSSSELMDKGKEASSSNNTMVEKGKEVSSNSEIMDKRKEVSNNGELDSVKEDETYWRRVLNKLKPCFRL